MIGSQSECTASRAGATAQYQSPLHLGTARSSSGPGSHRGRSDKSGSRDPPAHLHRHPPSARRSPRLRAIVSRVLRCPVVKRYPRYVIIKHASPHFRVKLHRGQHRHQGPRRPLQGGEADAPASEAAPWVKPHTPTTPTTPTPTRRRRLPTPTATPDDPTRLRRRPRRRPRSPSATDIPSVVADADPDRVRRHPASPAHRRGRAALHRRLAVLPRRQGQGRPGGDAQRRRRPDERVHLHPARH